MKQGWEIKKLSEIGKVFNGNSINEKVKKDKYTGLDDGMPFIATKDVSFDSEIDYENGVRIPLNEINQFKIAPPNTPLICAEGGSAGRKIGFTNQDVCFGNKLFALVPNKNADSKYVYYYYFTSSFQKHFSTEMAGIIGGVSMNKFKDIEIPLPPLPEQQRIVSILDEAFAAIAKAKANAEQNLKNVKELFESYLQGVFENGNCETKSFDEVCEISSKLIDPRKPEFQNLIHVGAGNIESKTGLLSGLKTAKEESLISGKFLFDESMVLYSKIRPYLMKVVNCDFQGLCSADIYPLKPFEKIITKDYLYHLLLTKEFTDYAILGSQRAGMPKVNREHLFAYKFKLPTLQKQQTIVRQLDALRAETQKLEAVYQKKIDDLEELKKSILQKAFAGELTTSVSTNVSVAKVIPLQKVEGISPTDLQAGITALALQKHIEKNQQHTFHHVKAEKIVHLSEYILNIDLERNPVKDAAGPNDFTHAKKVESRARKAGFYSVYKNGEYYDYQQGKNINSVIQKTKNSLGEKADTLSQVIDILIPMTTQQAEIVATVYAAWNNLLLNGVEFTNEDVVTEARENWHKEKVKISRDKFFNAIEWMQKNELLIPKGSGKSVKMKIK